MGQKVNPIPEGCHTVTPYMTIKNAAQAIEFYKQAFNAQELFKHTCEESGLIIHAKIKLGDSILMISDEFPEPYGCGMKAPSASHATTIALHIYAEDVDVLFNQAVQAGAKSVMPVEDVFWGERYGQLEDPFGHRWSISTRTEILTPEEVNQRAMECFSNK